MTNPEKTTYGKDNLIAGVVNSAYKTAGTASYFRGQPLGRIEATGVYGNFDATGTYDVLNETDIPVSAPIVINATIAAASGTAVLVGSVLYVTDATDAGLAEAGRDAVAGLESIKAICAADVVLASPGEIPTYITGSSVSSGSIVGVAGAPLTVTTAMIENAQDNGIIIKESN